MNLQGWYPLALSRDVAPGTSAGVRVEGAEFVMWRDIGGAPHVWEDRCPHRGMKMSFGFVRGDRIACLYHGWQYDTAGQCRYIPAHPDLVVPGTIKVPAFAVAETGGILWGCFEATAGEAAPAPALQTPVTPLKSVFAACSANRLVEIVARTRFGDEPPSLTRRSQRIADIRLNGTTVIAGVLPITQDTSALHLVVDGDIAPEQAKIYALWTDQLRRDADAAATDAPLAEFA